MREKWSQRMAKLPHLARAELVEHLAGGLHESEPAHVVLLHRDRVQVREAAKLRRVVQRVSDELDLRWMQT